MKTKYVIILLLISCGCSHQNDKQRDFNDTYSGEYINRLAFPMGGMGAGMICLEGNGCLSHVSIKNRPDLKNEPFMFAALSIKDLKNGCKVLEGPVQKRKLYGSTNAGGGLGDKSYGFPRFSDASFQSKFPFGTVNLKDDDIPMDVEIKGWSPFIPTDADNSSLPVCAMEYTFKNTSDKELEAIFSYNSSNFIADNSKNSSVAEISNGFVHLNSVTPTKGEGQFYSGSGTHGLKGEYFKNSELKGAPFLTRTDQKINFRWTSEPLRGLPLTNLSARWTGYIKVDETAKYIISVTGDDGYKLYLDEKVFIDNWSDHPEESDAKELELQKDKIYPVVLEYFQNGGGAAINLEYKKVDLNSQLKSESFAVFTDDPTTKVDYCWFSGGKFDTRTMLWNDISNRTVPTRPVQPHTQGSSIYVPFKLKPNESKTIKVYLAWYMPTTKTIIGSGVRDNAMEEKENTFFQNSTNSNCDPVKKQSKYYTPWYASKFSTYPELIKYWQVNYSDLKTKSELFADLFYSSDLPPVVIEAIAANLSILKSPTVLRQEDGRLWGWEGCDDTIGSCSGSCTHVWNYAQAVPHLFPTLERSLRETEFFVNQDSSGHQMFRAGLPIREIYHNFYAAADGQLGGIMKVYREWRISGDTEWLKKIWGNVKGSFDYCSKTWDPSQKGVLEEPHHNTYDIEFWGQDGMCTSFYLGAMTAVIQMGKALNEDVSKYEALFQNGKKIFESDLYNGEFFYQKILWNGLKSYDSTKNVGGSFGLYSDEAKQIFKKEGPKYQYGNGCLSDGILGCWIADMCGLDEFVDHEKIKNHLLSVYKYNFFTDLTDHVNPQRPGYACGNEGGLLLCTWPKGNSLSLPFPYSNEVWTGIEYQVAAHLMSIGEVEKGLNIVREVRKRYDGRTRNPFDEYECGDWYARAMSSYGMIQGLTGLRYDAIDKTLFIDSRIGNTFKCFISTETGFGMAGLKNGIPFIEVKYGKIIVNSCYVSGKTMKMENNL